MSRKTGYSSDPNLKYKLQDGFGIPKTDSQIKRQNIREKVNTFHGQTGIRRRFD